MAVQILNWFVDTLARTETLDLQFVNTDLKDIPISEDDLVESACLDSLANQTVDESSNKSHTPIGKRVI
jgi:hypothetical protein